MKQFKIRASACGQIMTNDRSGKSMGQTAKTYLETWVKEQLYGRRQEIQTKQMEKGIIVEDDSIDFVADYLGFGMLLKNEQHYVNDFMTGTPDIIMRDLIIDVKNSWDCFSFPLFVKNIPTKDYYWQAQVYMALTETKQYKLIYTLMDTPPNIIEREAYWYAKNNGYEELDEDIMNEFIEKHTYSNLPDNLRIKIYDIQRDDNAIKSIENRVIECRTYINELL